MPYHQSKTLLNVYLKKIEAEKSYDEMKRLLYVAITRAKRTVHLMARLVVKNNEVVSPSRRSFLGMLWPLNQAEFTSSLSDAQSEKTIEVEPFVYERLPLDQFEWLQPLPLQEKINTFDTVVWAMPNEFARIVGIVFHEILQSIGDIGIEQWSLDTWNERQTFYQKRLRQWQLSAAEINHGMTLIDDSMKNLIKDSRAIWLLSNKHRFIRQEYALSTKSNGTLVNIMIDRTFIDHDNVRWIIDYKTTLHFENDHRKLEQYKSQLELYQSVMEKFDTAHPIKKGIYFPMKGQWLDF